MSSTEADARAQARAAQQAPAAPQGLWVVVVAFIITMLLAALDQTIVSTALPKIASDFNALDELSWVVSAYLIASAISQPLYGKISDLYGRKRVLLAAIVIFLIGSALSGMSQNITQLIIFRFLQGMGGGGLMTLVTSAIADIAAPKDRGKYQGIFGGAFGLASVAGPLLGGLFTDHISWRWIFYINLPLGLLALVAIALKLHTPVQRREHTVDYAGAVLLSITIAALMLVTIWAGQTYAWSSSQITGLLVTGIVGAAIFSWWQTRAKEPLIPLRLFKSRIFTVSTLLATASATAMFAAIIFMPVYQQIVRGNSATASGLLGLPLVVGLVGASIISGNVISKTGKYRVFPLAGTLITALGLWFMTHLQTDTSQWLIGAWMLLLGVGMGLYMQVAILAVQNSADPKDLGTATSTVTFFRSIGGSFGAAVFGAILTSRLSSHLAAAFPGVHGMPAFSSSSLAGGAAQIHRLPPAIGSKVLEAFALSFQDVYFWAIPFTLAGFLIALFLSEVPLHKAEGQLGEVELAVGELAPSGLAAEQPTGGEASRS